MSPQACYAVSCVLLGMYLVHNSLELLACYATAVGRRLMDFPHLIVNRPRLTRLLWQRRAVWILLTVRAGSGLLLLETGVSGRCDAALCGFVLILELLVSYRLNRVSEAGCMAMPVLGAAFFSSWTQSALVAHLGLIFIAAQVCLAYLGAGVSKLRTQSWRSGVFLTRLFAASSFRIPALAVRLERHALLGRLCAWSVIVFELSFAVGVSGGERAAAAMIVLGLLFHIGVALSMGLPAFLLTFGAAYPAVLYTAQHLHAPGGLGLFPVLISTALVASVVLATLFRENCLPFSRGETPQPVHPTSGQ